MGYQLPALAGRAVRIAYDPDPVPTAPIRLTYEEYLEGIDRLVQAGFPFERTPEEAWPHFVGWRVNYESIVDAMAAGHAAAGTLDHRAPVGGRGENPPGPQPHPGPPRGPGPREPELAGRVEQDLQDALLVGVEHAVGAGASESPRWWVTTVSGRSRPAASRGSSRGQVLGMAATVARTVSFLKSTRAMGKGRAMLRFTPTTETVATWGGAGDGVDDGPVQPDRLDHRVGPPPAGRLEHPGRPPPSAASTGSAPKEAARASRSPTVSTARTRAGPKRAQHCRARIPTGPSPITATVEPGVMSARSAAR